MPRLTPAEGIEAYRHSTPPQYLVDYQHDKHGEDMMDLATGLIGALLQLDLPSLSGPELGSPIPLVVTKVPGDIIRIFVDPYIDAFGDDIPDKIPGVKKARQHVELTALSYQGEKLYLNTEDLYYTNYYDLSIQLQRQGALLDKFARQP